MKRLSIVIAMLLSLTSAALADNYSEGMQLYQHAKDYQQFSWASGEFKKAYPLLAAAGKEGYADADYFAGLIKLNGLDGEQVDLDKAFAHFSAAVENEAERGRLELGDIYHASQFSRHADAKAFGLWKQAYDFNEPGSRSRVFAAHWLGIGTEQDKAEAARIAKGHYEEISNSDYVDAMLALAQLLDHAGFRDSKYDAEALENSAWMYALTNMPRYMLEGARILVDNKIESFWPALRQKGSRVITTAVLDDIIRRKYVAADVQAEACVMLAKFSEVMGASNRESYDANLKYQYGYTSGDALLTAASLGNPEAIEMAALWYRIGLGLPKNIVKAKEYEALLAEKFPERVKAPAEVTYVVGEGDIVEEPAVKAQFPGPPGTWKSWVTSNLNDPGMQEGSVTVSFIVEQDGSLSDIKIVSANATEDMKREALRVTRLTPKLIPAKDADGNPVRTRLKCTYKFRLQLG